MNAVKQAMEAIMAVHEAFGAPGDYGYGTKQGDALLALYQAHDVLANAQDCPACGSVGERQCDTCHQ